MDYYAGKGFVRVVVETRDAPVVILNTHLHANYARPGELDDYNGIRAAQVIQPHGDHPRGRGGHEAGGPT